MLNHVQMRFYSDGKYTLDFYCSFEEGDVALVSNTYSSTINKINVYNTDNKGPKSYPFKIIYCANCAQMILTNRKEGSVFRCVNCKKESPVCTVNKSRELEIVKTFQDNVGINCTPLDGFTGYLLLFPFDANRQEVSKIRKILDDQNFIEESKDNILYKYLFFRMFSHNMIIKSINPSSVLFYSTTFSNSDYEYNNSIEKIDIVLESIKKINKNTMSASTAVNPQTTPKFMTATDSAVTELLEEKVDEDYLNVDAQIVLAYQYIRNKRFKDAHKLLIAALNIESDNEEAKRALVSLQYAMKGQDLLEMEVDCIEMTNYADNCQNDSPKYIFTNAFKKKEQYMEALKKYLNNFT